MISYLKHNEIDKKKWDHCISVAPNGFIYALSWYLDVVSSNWDALVYNDYEKIMPLPNRSKFGIHYLFTPSYVQQLGIIGENNNSEQTDSFIARIPSIYKLIELSMNEQNKTLNSHHVMINKVNYILNLEKTYSEIQKGYSRNCKRNIAKAIQAGYQIAAPLNTEKFSKFIQEHLQKQIHKITASDFQLLKQITEECIKRDRAEIICVQNKSGKTVAAGSFLISGDRVIFSVCASSPEGKANQAMYYLVNSQIEKYSGKYKLFDFSGSNIKGIAYFNSTFGAEKIQYPFLKINRLNWFEKLLSGKFY
ncbi:MAG: hypothetical protein JXB24_01565 [Bacteroidales bacterium]|nr:hypothetical protein [Bacteroidales bacterium]